MPRFPLLALLLTLACRPYETRISVWAPGLDSLPSPVAHLPVVVLPYDRDSILGALEARATPRPLQKELDSLVDRARAPLLAYMQASWHADSARRSLAAARAVMDSTPRNSDAYQTAYLRFSTLADSLPRLDRALADAGSRLGRSDPSVTARLAQVRAAIHQWEDSTYRDYGTSTSAITRTLGLTPVSATTDDVGSIEVALRSGRWWAYARAPDVNDPEREWYWNVRIRGTLIRLDRTNATHRIRP
ncbi:MAG: hypothetical protein WBC97_11850 [Gemmatimonadales bacterium]